MGNSGGSQNQTTTTHFEPPDWTTGKTGSPYQWDDYVRRGGEIAQKYGSDPSLIYGNMGQPMVAQMSQLQNAAANGMYGLASQGNPNESLASGYLANLLGGGQQNIQPDNPYIGKTSSYGGDSPYFQKMLDAQNKDITDAYGRGVAAQTDAAAARSGAFGGSAYNETVQNNQKSLADRLAQNESAQRNAQYERSANLEQQDLARNSGLGENEINRAWQGYENNANRGLQGIGLINQMGNTDLQRWLSVMGAGDLQQQTQQNNINAARDLFNANVQWPIFAEQLYGDVLQRASGQGGSSSQTMQLPGYSGILNGLGAAGGLYSLLK